MIDTYEGRRLDPGEKAVDGDDGITYLFALSDGEMIHGRHGVNDTRYINHSCKPNCVAVEGYDDNDALTVEVRAKRSIRFGEELFLDYALVVHPDDVGTYQCLCGERTCRGTMVGR